MSPLKVLARGYSMTRTESCAIVRCIEQVRAGDKLTIEVSDGSINAAVLDSRRRTQ